MLQYIMIYYCELSDLAPGVQPHALREPHRPLRGAATAPSLAVSPTSHLTGSDPHPLSLSLFSRFHSLIFTRENP